MTVKVMGEGEVLREAAYVLVQHLNPAKVARFWAGWQISYSQYLAWRDDQFGTETVASLYDKVQAYQEKLKDEPAG